MRREARRKEENSEWWKNKKIIASGSAVIIVLLFVIGLSIYSITDDEANTQDNIPNSNQIISLAPGEEINSKTESASSSIGNSIEESQTTNNTNMVNENSANNTVNNNTNSSRTKTIANNEEETTATNSDTEESKEVIFDWPVKGEILKAFSGENLLYSSTLQEWVAHNGIDIRADKTSVVSAAADGTVKSIKNDPRYGLTVVIEHANGYRTVYANLLTAEFVVEGEKVTQGQSIGTVGNTANFEIADDSHLHFEILEDSEYIDPLICLK